ncbi:hypothetical protein AOLI_G00211180 [Acnodon oligacanthus]
MEEETSAAQTPEQSSGRDLHDSALSGQPAGRVIALAHQGQKLASPPWARTPGSSGEEHQHHSRNGPQVHGHRPAEPEPSSDPHQAPAAGGGRGGFAEACRSDVGPDVRGCRLYGVTLLILADIVFFCSPLVYEKNKTQIDRYVELVRTQLEEKLEKLQEKLPGAVQRSKTD